MFWTEAADRMRTRAREESWTAEDVNASVIQASLLSYCSSAHSAKYGERYVESSPEGYAHNCPWNDWGPPSLSERFFQEAPANKDPGGEPIRQRVRVRVSPFETLTQSSLTAFASVETGSAGAPCLRLRRGAIVLASMTLSTLKIKHVADLVVGLLPEHGPDVASRPDTPDAFLHFENPARQSKFLSAIAAAHHSS
jgi:hypothetical protein